MEMGHYRNASHSNVGIHKHICKSVTLFCGGNPVTSVLEAEKSCLRSTSIEQTVTLVVVR